MCVYRKTARGLRQGLLQQLLLPKGPMFDRQGPWEPGPSDPSEKTVEATHTHTTYEIRAHRYISTSKAITSALVNKNLEADLNINTHIMSKQVRK